MRPNQPLAPIDTFPSIAIGAALMSAVITFEEVVTGGQDLQRIRDAYGTIIGLFGTRGRLFDALAAFAATQETEKSLPSIEELADVFHQHDDLAASLQAVRAHLLEPLMIEGLKGILENLENIEEEDIKDEARRLFLVPSPEGVA